MFFTSKFELDTKLKNPKVQNLEFPIMTYSSAVCLLGNTNDKRIPHDYWHQPWKRLSCKGSNAIPFSNREILKVLARTLATEHQAGQKIVNCIPGFERATNLLTITINTMVMVIG